MPVVEVDPDELRRLTGHAEKSDAELREDLFALGLEFEGVTPEGDFELEFAPDRLDRLSVAGVARSLRYQYGDDRGVYVPETTAPEWTIRVEGSVSASRPYVTGAVIRGLDLDAGALDALIQLQEKLHATMGRGRAKGAIGIHDLTMLKGESLTEAGESGADGTGKSITYRGIDPEGDRFVPLDSDAERTPAGVLEEHPTGAEYGDLVRGYDRYPAIYDDVGLFSFPPVINGRRTEVTTDSRDLFVELTGTDQWTVDRMGAIVCYALDARGGQVEEVRIEYAEDHAAAAGRERLRPDFEVRQKQVTHDRIETTMGIDLDPEDAVDYFERSGLDAEIVGVGDSAERRSADHSSGQSPREDDEIAYDVSIPPYRVDVRHPVDLVDDLGRAYGFNDLTPRYPDVSTIGGRTESSRLEAAARTQLVGLGFEDLLNFHMINEAKNYDRMRTDPGSDVLGGARAPTIAEPYSGDYTMLRTWVLPSILLVLENNTHRAYPQDLAEIGFAAGVDESQNTGVAECHSVGAALARHDASYEDAKARLQALARSFEADLATPATDHPTFIEGRAAEVVLDGDSAGVIGEVHPAVLVEHDLEVPVAAFEFRLDALADPD
jgi:phenylalanyl-tRNA synthetase beta chain